ILGGPGATSGRGDRGGPAPRRRRGDGNGSEGGTSGVRGLAGRQARRRQQDGRRDRRLPLRRPLGRLRAPARRRGLHARHAVRPAHRPRGADDRVHVSGVDRDGRRPVRRRHDRVLRLRPDPLPQAGLHRRHGHRDLRDRRARPRGGQDPLARDLHEPAAGGRGRRDPHHEDRRVAPRARMAAPLAVLAGTRVLSFTQFLLGPSGVQFLADLGADVIKIEPPGGRLWERNWSGCDLYKNGVSVFFLAAHRNQRSLSLDLKRPEGQAIARRLVEGADVLVQNFRPGVMARFGLDWERVATVNPRLIYVSASGYGESSPYRARPGQDLLIQAVSGLASISGRADQPPTPVGTAVVDQHGAALLALGVLGALLERPGGWAAPILTHAEAFADPGFRAADAVEEITHPVAGPVRLLRFPLEFSTGRATVRRAPPSPGEHADKILGELGYARDEIW